MASNISINTSALGIPWELNTTYRVAITDGFVIQSGNLNLPISSNSSITSFITPSGLPTISSSSPTNGDTASQENQTISFNLDRSYITALSGNVSLKYANATTIKTFTIGSDVSITGNTVSVQVGNLLAASTSYYLTTSANIAQDPDGFKYPGISNNSTLSFTTASNWQSDLIPAGVSVVYGEDSTTLLTMTPKIVIGQSYNSSSYTLNVQAISANTITSLSTTGSLGTSVWSANVLTLTGNATTINSRLDTLTMISSIGYTGNITLNYLLTTPSLTTSTQSQLIRNNATVLKNGNILSNRSYIGNNSSTIFSDTSPYIDDTGTTYSSNYEIRLSAKGNDNVVHGEFGSSANASLFSSNISITGTKDYINSILPTVKYFPDLSQTGNVQYRYEQLKNGIIQDQQVLNLIYAGQGNISQTFTYSTPVTSVFNHTLTHELVKYGTKVEVTLIGGGGDGGNPTIIEVIGTGGGGGGGGGQAITANLGMLPSGNYTIIVGSNNQNTSAFGYTALKGNVGQGSYTHFYDGHSTYNLSGGDAGGGSPSGQVISGSFTYPALGSPVGGNGGGSSIIYSGRAGRGWNNTISSYPALSSSSYGHGGNGGRGSSLAVYQGSPGAVIIRYL